MSALDSVRSAALRRGGRILGGAVLAAARAAMARRRLQTVIVGMVVLLSAATGVLAIGLIVASHGPFDESFAADVPLQQLAGTAHASGVDAAAGPFDEITASVSGSGDVRLGDGVMVGRADQGGPVDQLKLDAGRWLTGPGQIVLSRSYAGPNGPGRQRRHDRRCASIAGGRHRRLGHRHRRRVGVALAN